MFIKSPFILSLILLILLPCCTRKVYVNSGQGIADGKYDSEFPSKNASSEIETITRSVCKIYCITYYRTYYFPESAKFSQLDIGNYKFGMDTPGMAVSHESTTGTGLILCGDYNRVCLLTCAHILDYPDTLISFYNHPGTSSTEYIQAISFRDRQEIYAKDLPACGALYLLAMDRENDIALIGKLCEGMTNPVQVFNYPLGKARDLGWGSFVYIIGYPAGTLMVTKGIVSNPNSDRNGSFMIDALFNKGSSGSIVLAIRDGIPHFELVGMVRSVSSEKKYFLKPDKDIFEGTYSQSEPYPGRIKIGIDETFNYGVTYSIPIEAINGFYDLNRNNLFKMGYNLDPLFKR
jgi:hypothetical protein